MGIPTIENPNLCQRCSMLGAFNTTLPLADLFVRLCPRCINTWGDIVLSRFYEEDQMQIDLREAAWRDNLSSGASKIDMLAKLRQDRAQLIYRARELAREWMKLNQQTEE